ncbi:23S rRNA (uracil(1939)-C(5))-methyltransferase RlmD [Salisediminibacterium halotolerans]|uniref:23S rRNA (Uracil1939-C5)-methyltransferase n=2 Tax=Salisediminibacterium halotolerans TaxID=517425 RepID=A0A1H9VWH7_9BACI|nr:23S rRNA (uracil(1939)-C(5))-methyltransferase RlmD [Salisediminibacterium haloalkalitolerans]SES25879.1 23S rRNA (uracil1939-C5)-methyltransferase [Salisediminibacterium haloalkalitolerans]
MSNTAPPVQKNETVQVTFEDLTHDGAGVAKIDGYPLFVKKALPGETGEVKVIKVKKNYGFGRLISLENESPERTEPPCPIFDRCGGCQLQHLSAAGQNRYKTNLVSSALARIGGMDDVKVHPVLAMDDPWRYRNKAQVPVGFQNGELVAGFYAERSHKIVDMNECLIQHDVNDRLLQTVKQAAKDFGITAYNEETGKGLMRHVVIRHGQATGEKMVILVTNGSKLPQADKLIEKIHAAVDGVTSIVQNINTAKTNVVFGEQTHVLDGKAAIEDKISDIRFHISPRSFYQVNSEQTEVLYDEALKAAGLSGDETVLDVYCGIGTISLFLAQKAKHVYGIEAVPEAVNDAKKNATLNAIDNASFYVGEAETLMPWWRSQGMAPDVIVVDPPRKGCDEALLDAMAAMNPAKIVYVSCNPATLARDMAYLAEKGYRSDAVQPVDMFPQTTHVECVVLLEKTE